MPSITEGTCPNCGLSQQGAEIPEKDRHCYGGSTHFMRTIAVEYAYDHPARYDGVSEWQCPACEYREGRWSGRILTGNEYEPRFGGQQ